MIDKLGLDGLGGASVRVEPTPQVLLGVSEETATPAVVGLEPVAWYLENEDEYMSEKLRKEHERLNSYTFKLCKVAHPLYSAATVERLVQERDEARSDAAYYEHNRNIMNGEWVKVKEQLAAMTQERDKCIKECNEFWGKRSDQDFELICALQAREQQLREVLRNLSFMAMTSGGTGGRDDGLVSSIEKANDALALTQDDTVLRKWGAKLLHDMARKKLLWTASEIHCKAYELRSGKCAT